MAKISDTSSGRLFLALFLGEGEFPKILHGLLRGNAINLTQKLNAYHKRWAKEENREMLFLSAKARGTLEDPENWSVEISYSPQNGLGRERKPVDWIEKLHTQMREKEEEKVKAQTLPQVVTVQEDNPL